MRNASVIIEDMALKLADIRRNLDYEAIDLYESGQLDEEAQQLKDKIGELSQVNRLLSELVAALATHGSDGGQLKKSLSNRYKMRVIEDADKNSRGPFYWVLRDAEVLDEH